jgi:hypothetical protein
MQLNFIQLTAASVLLAGSAVLAAPVPDANPLLGQEPAGRSAPAPRLPDGHPDFSGYWKGIKEKNKPTGNIGRDEPDFKLPFTPEGEKAQQYNRTKTVDPEALCILGGAPRHDASGLPFEILHTPKRLAFLYFYTTYRLIPLDGRAHESDPDPKYFGDAIGKWDGDALVIDSIGFKDSKDGKFWIDENGDPQSDQTHLVERWTRPDRDHIHVRATISDPKYYTRPLTFDRTWVLGPAGQGLAEYACAENNVDAPHLGPGPGAIGPDGNRGYAVPNLPKDPPGPDAYNR